MIATCFFCQNLLSDYIEGILPSSRHEDIRKHLCECENCDTLLKDLKSTLDLVGKIKPVAVPEDLSSKVIGTVEPIKGPLLHRRHFSRKILFIAIPILLVFSALAAFPQLFPWISRMRAGENSADFVRYFPLLQGADEILEEHATWFKQKDSFNGSLWEEGGLSPEEFEKAFQKKGSSGEEQ